MRDLSWADDLARPEIADFEPYLPGRSVESVRRELGLRRLFKLASNENPLGPSPRALAAMRAVCRRVFQYPDGASTALREALARQARVSTREVIVGAGSDELIELLAKTFVSPSDNIVVSQHAFIRYRLAGQLMGAQVIEVPMRRFAHDLEAMAGAIGSRTKIVFIANPNNPTGTYNTRQELRRFLEAVRRLGGRAGRAPLVVVDEAYAEYARALAPDYPDTLAWRKRYPFLVILRTFSKIHALAGLRVGYGFADRRVIAVLDRVRPPFNVSTLGQAAAEASLGDPRHVARGVALVRRERERVIQGLTRLGLAVIPSVANFVLVDVGPRQGAQVFTALLRRGLIVRAMDEYNFPHHVRITFGMPAENAALLRALREVLDR